MGSAGLQSLLTCSLQEQATRASHERSFGHWCGAYISPTPIRPCGSQGLLHLPLLALPVPRPSTHQKQAPLTRPPTLLLSHWTLCLTTITEPDLLQADPAQGARRSRE